MMLRQRDGYISITIKNNTTNEIASYDFHKNLSPKQARALATKPILFGNIASASKKNIKEKILAFISIAKTTSTMEISKH